MAQIDQIEVTQGDRDAAREYHELAVENLLNTVPKDGLAILAQAFARHRIASEEAAVLRGVEAARTAVFAVLRERDVDPDTFAYVAQALNPQAIARETPDADKI